MKIFIQNREQHVSLKTAQMYIQHFSVGDAFSKTSKTEK